MLVCGRTSRAGLFVLTTLLVPAQLRAQTTDAAESGQPRDLAQAVPRLDSSIIAPKPISTPLDYPENATGSATVLLELTVDASGHVASVRLVSGDAPFAAAALNSAKNWVFEPARRDGEAIAARIRYTVNFAAPREAEEPSPAVSSAPAQTLAKPVPMKTVQSPAQEIVVLGRRTPPGSVTLTREETRAVPGSFGDPLRAIEAQPGVVPIVSGLPEFFIRGSPPANVGFFFDGIELPLLYHAFFGPSVVHPGFIDSIDFYPGASPAEYGRFAGPVIAVNSRPLASRATGEANVRLIDAGGLIESGPLRPCPGGLGTECSGAGVRAAGRYSYAGLVLSLLSDAKLNYWDYQTQASFRVARKDELGILAFGAYDLFQAPQTSVNTGAELTFHRVDLRWDHEFGPASSLRLALTFGADRAAGSDNQSSVVTDRSLRVRSEYKARWSDSVSLHAGLDARADDYGLEANARNLNYLDFNRLFPPRTDTTAGGYVSFQLQPARGIRVTPGLRADVYTSRGVHAVGVDPRISAEFELGRGVRSEHSLGIAHQRPNFAAQVPGAQVADLGSGLQWALLWSSGLRVHLPFDTTGTLTVFRTAYFHALDPIGGARDFTIDQTALDRRATVSAAGLELHLSRPLTKKLGGFVSYTFSRSEESTATQKAPSGFDRPHIFQAALSYDFGHSLIFGARAVLYSGVPELNLEGSPHFSASRRGAPFFRLDLRAEKRFRLGQNGYWGVVGEILNASSTREVIRLDCGEVCRERAAGPVILPSVGLQAGF